MKLLPPFWVLSHFLEAINISILGKDKKRCPISCWGTYNGTSVANSHTITQSHLV